MDTTVRLGPLKFSLRASIDHHGPAIHSGHYTASINCCKNHSIATITQLRSLELLTVYYISYSINWHMIIGLEQEGGSLIAPMALEHPLHPIDNRSRNRRRNLWVGRCVSFWWPLFPSRSSYMLLYMSSVFFGLPIVSCSDDNSLISGCLWLLAFVLKNTLILGIWSSTIPHLPWCFCPWTFFQNIRFNMVASDPFMSHLATQLGYSAGEFQALQLIVLATFGAVD